jgi:hypothetical protein
MAALVLDTGALIAIDRGDRRVGAMLHEAARLRVDAVTSCVCVAEAWRHPTRQARLARALAGIIEHPLGPDAARACGTLLAKARTHQIADAATTLLARDGDLVLTSDADDIERLLDINRTSARVEAV